MYYVLKFHVALYMGYKLRVLKSGVIRKLKENTQLSLHNDGNCYC